jgi:aspartyl-tRNA(Asn)/glutamyl-tRNA(Gln) amidotransferase subunit C
MISSADVQKLAQLARISMTEEESGQFAGQVEAILGYISQIQEASGELPASKAGVLHTVLRADGEATPAGTYTQALLAQAPAREGDYVKVQRILGKSE